MGADQTDWALVTDPAVGDARHPSAFRGRDREEGYVERTESR
jgi:hypothetical protein